jgi:serine/threonine protein kinase/tetratricopeptide (TPR) repeat protein
VSATQLLLPVGSAAAYVCEAGAGRSTRRRSGIPSRDHPLPDLRDQLQHALGNSYTIERELGGGGMSRVFLATELALGRRVVVKVLPAVLMGDVSTARFRREISFAAQLQHPHLVPLLSAGEIDGLPYYTMPYVEGESLRARLAHGALPIPETISILRDVARALEYAHAKGVTHRDIKPDNVLLAGRSAVVTDFGVAKAITDAAAVNGTMTVAGAALGTPAYMAPEQASGDATSDHRVDIYAFGVMAYEMIAGDPPFAGRSVHAVLAAHAVEDPPDIASLRPATPHALAELVMRCLAKRPGDRPQSAAEIAQQLDGVATPLEGSHSGPSYARTTTPAAVRRRLALALAAVAVIGSVVFWRVHARSTDPAIRSIAVLPFENTSGDTALDYLQDGITDHVRDALNALPELTVKARSSSQQMRGRSAREIASRLGVAAVVQGTVSGSGERLHVTAELVRTADDAALWSATFDGRPSDLIGMQDTITRAVTGRLHVVPVSSGAGQLASAGARGTANDTAYDLLLRGRYAFDRTDFARAESFFQQALAHDPHFARARAYLAVAQAALPLNGAALDSIDAEARMNAEAALAVDSTVIEAYIAESNAIFNDMHMAESLVPLERAMRLDSTHVDLLIAYALALAAVGRISDGLAASRRAHDRDPLSVTASGVYGSLLALSGRFSDAIAQMREALVLDPGSALLHRELGFALAFADQPDSAAAHLRTSFDLDPTTFGGRSNLVFADALVGRWRDAESERVRVERTPGGTSPNYEMAISQLAFGDFDKAMTSLERSVDAREPLLWIKSLACDPLFDPLKPDPRFGSLMARLGAKACARRVKWPIRGIGSATAVSGWEAR